MAKEFYISNKSNRSLPIIDSRSVSENDIDASYDERGNLLKLSGSQDLHWNYRDNIAYVDIITRPSGKNDSEYYVYDSGGQRVRKVTETYQNNETNSTRVEKIYFGDIEVTRTYQESGLIKEKYTAHVADDKSRVALHHYWTKGTPDETQNSQSRYQLSNHLDSVALELNDNAEIMTYEEYLPFGGTALIAGKTAREVTEKEYRYSGKEKDESTGLYYYGARYYAPWLLRWINPDPAGTVDGLNLYQFVVGNPAIYRDKGGNARNQGENAVDYTKFINKFQEGDKIYGLAKSRGPYITAAKSLYPNANTTIDDLNDRFIGTAAVGGLGQNNYYNQAIGPLEDEETQSFKTFIENYPKYDPRIVPGVLKDLNSLTDEEWTKTMRDAYVRVGRASKAGIKFTTIEQRKKVHFVLDSLALSAVAQKVLSHALPSSQYDSNDINTMKRNRGGILKDVTGQELRYLYRNRDNKQIMQNVIFWKEGKEVYPPWKNDERDYEYERADGEKFEITGMIPSKNLWEERLSYPPHLSLNSFYLNSLNPLYLNSYRYRTKFIPVASYLRT